MKLKEMIGSNIKVVEETTTGKQNVTSRIGMLESVRKNYFVVKFKNYSEGFTNADVIAPLHQSIYVRINKEWEQVTKEMLA